MHPVDRKLIALARSQHQVFSREQARDAGLSRSALAKRVARGSLIACSNEGLHFPGVVLTPKGDLQNGLFDLGPDALITARSAAWMAGLDGCGPGALDFLVPRSARNRSTPGGLVRSTHDVSRLDKVTIDGLRCTSITRTIVELLAIAPDLVGDALACGTRMRRTAPAAVERRLTQLGARGRAGVAAFRKIMRDGTVESGLERRFVQLLADAGLPAPVLQRRHRLKGFGVVRVDFEYPALGIVLEVGGRLGYLSHAERQNQERRRTSLQLGGSTVYFFTRDDVVGDPDHVIATVTAALQSRAA